MARYLREGECNRCGECCGADLGNGGISPYPDNWPSSIRNWQLSDINEKLCPQLLLLGVGQIGEDTVGVPQPTGLYRVGGKPYYYCYPGWESGNPGKQGVLRKDVSNQHDGSVFNAECPFLMVDPGDGTRPCALVGSRDDGAFKKWCENEPTSPRLEKDVLSWQAAYPSCSYTWVLIEE